MGPRNRRLINGRHPPAFVYMCGISGIVNREDGGIDRDRLGRMGAMLLHRGPDASGIYVDGRVGLASEIGRSWRTGPTGSVAGPCAAKAAPIAA